MKKLISFLIGLGVAAHAQVGPPPASPSEVTAGTDKYKYITPYSAAQAGITSPTNGLTATQVSNYVTFVLTNGATDIEADEIVGDAFIGNGGGLTNVSAVNATNLYGNSLVRNAYFVDSSNGSDPLGDGSSGKPWATTGKAETNAVVGASIYVLSGTYIQPIRRGGVPWIFSRGARVISSVSGTPVIQCYAKTNFVILGEGSFENTAGGTVIANTTGGVTYDGDIEFQARYVSGGALIYVDQSRKDRIHFYDMYWNGALNDTLSFDAGFGVDFQLTNVKVNAGGVSFDGNLEFPFTVSSCVVSVSPGANTYRIGTWLVNTNIPATIEWP